MKIFIGCMVYIVPDVSFGHKQLDFVKSVTYDGSFEGGYVVMRSGHKVSFGNFIKTFNLAPDQVVSPGSPVFNLDPDGIHKPITLIEILEKPSSVEYDGLVDEIQTGMFQFQEVLKKAKEELPINHDSKISLDVVNVLSVEESKENGTLKAKIQKCINIADECISLNEITGMKDDE